MNRDTICVQGGYTPGNGEPRQIPIIQSTTFKYATSEAMGKLFDLDADAYFYSRLKTHTCDLVAKQICELEGGTAAMLTSSGQAANFFALFNLCEAGDHIVASSTIYGGTFNLISVTMKKMGIEATFVDPLCTEEELNAAFRPNTKVVFGETIANPALTVLDIEKFAKAAHAHGVPLIVDNTFPTPVNCRPFEWGADIVTHSTTKYMDGHGAVLGGAIVDGGKFDWMAHAEKFPGLCTPDDSYHGITYAERFGKEGAFITKATAQLMRDFGSMQSPMNAYMLNLGLESLHVRMQRHCENGMAVAQFLEAHPKVAYVNYCGLASSPYHALAEKYLPKGSFWMSLLSDSWFCWLLELLFREPLSSASWALMVKVLILPERLCCTTVSSTVSPGFLADMMLLTVSESRTSWPSIWVMMSPARRPLAYTSMSSRTDWTHRPGV